MLDTKAMSYLMLLGNQQCVLDIIKEKGYPVKPINYYDVQCLE